MINDSLFDGVRVPDPLSRKKKSLPQSAAGQDLRWWGTLEEEQHRHTKLVGLLRRIAANQNYRRAANLHWARMYSDVEYPTLLRPSATPSVFQPARLTFNVTKNAIDTLVAKIAKNKPLPMFLTSGAKRVDKSRAKAMTWVVDAVYSKMKFFETATAVCLDTCVFGTGFIKIWRDDGDDVIQCERIYPWEIVVDDADGQAGEPMSMYHIRWIDRSVLAEHFKDDPEALAAIMRASNAPILDVSQPALDMTADKICVVEAWHRRSGKDATDGRHTLCIENYSLSDEQYDRDVFPIIALRRQRPLTGYWGMGVAQEIAGIQYEINVMAAKVQRSHNLMGGSIWLVPETAGIPSTHIDNGIGTIIRFKGPVPPQPQQMQPVHPESYKYLMDLQPKAYEISGISQLSAQSQKPKGLDSGAALREYNDIETERFMVFGMAYEQFSMECSRHVVYHCREIAKEFPEWAIQVKRRTHLDKVIWKDIALEDDDLFIQTFPTNALARTPAARMEQVQELAKTGWISNEQAKMLLDYPDLESVLSPESASYRITEKIIDRILDEGRYTPPVPQMNLPQSRAMAQLRWLEAFMDDEDPKRLTMLQNFSNAIDALILQASQQPANGEQGPGTGAADEMPGGMEGEEAPPGQDGPGAPAMPSAPGPDSEGAAPDAPSEAA